MRTKRFTALYPKWKSPFSRKASALPSMAFDGDYMGLHSVGEIGADVLKLDLRSLNKEKKSGSVQDVFDRAKTLRLTLTAEGIESMEQLSLLRKCGCTEGQGYVFSRPLSIEEFEKILKVGQDA